MADIVELERALSLTAAVAPWRSCGRGAMADRDAVDDELRPLTREDSLELLALQEVVAREARYGRALTVGTARAAGASWPEIGQAPGTSRQAAREAHQRWIDRQAEQFGRVGEMASTTPTPSRRGRWSAE